jgi:hypothetical protein
MGFVTVAPAPNEARHFKPAAVWLWLLLLCPLPRTVLRRGKRQRIGPNKSVLINLPPASVCLCSHYLPEHTCSRLACLHTTFPVTPLAHATTRLSVFGQSGPSLCPALRHCLHVRCCLPARPTLPLHLHTCMHSPAATLLPVHDVWGMSEGAVVGLP